MNHKYTQNDKKIPGILTRVCEICGREGLTEYMYAMGATWHVTGHHTVPSFNCNTEPSAQHWGCTPEHCLQALMICLKHKEHMSIGLLRKKHSDAKEAGLHHIAPEHRDVAERIGTDDWHFKYVEMLIKFIEES